MSRVERWVERASLGELVAAAVVLAVMYVGLTAWTIRFAFGISAPIGWCVTVGTLGFDSWLAWRSK